MDKNSKKNEIAVFGATGLIGSILIKYLNQPIITNYDM